MSEKETNSNDESNKKSGLKVYLKILGKILSILSIIFIVLKISKMGFDLSVIDNIPFLLVASFAALVCKIASVYTSSRAWGTWISFFSQKEISRKEVFVIYGKAGIGKYLPGNVMHYVERNLFAAQYGLSQKKIAIGSVFEIGTQIVSSLALSMILLPVSYWQKAFEIIKYKDHFPVIIVIMVVGFVLFASIVLVVCKRKMNGCLRKYISSHLFIAALKAFIRYVSTFVLLGSGMIFLWMSIYGSFPDFELIRIMLSSFSIAWVCGFVIPGASGGIGIREAVLTVLLEGFTDGCVLVFMVIAHRLITIIGDFAAYGLSLIIEKRSRMV